MMEERKLLWRPIQEPKRSAKGARAERRKRERDIRLAVRRRVEFAKMLAELSRRETARARRRAARAK